MYRPQGRLAKMIQARAPRKRPPGVVHPQFGWAGKPSAVQPGNMRFQASASIEILWNRFLIELLHHPC